MKTEFFSLSGVLMAVVLGACAAGLAFAKETPLVVVATPSSNVAWTIKTLKVVRSGNAQRGAQLNQKLECATCHGNEGIAVSSTWPNLSGQPAGYIFKVLKDYQDKKLSRTEHGRLMAFIVKEMSDQDVADIAAFYAQNAKAESKGGSAPEIATSLDLLGDPERLIPPCSVCHGNKAEGDFPDFPALSGQSFDYLNRVLNDFKSGRRANDVYSRMRLIAARLTQKEIEALAKYYSGLGTTNR